MLCSFVNFSNKLKNDYKSFAVIYSFIPSGPDRSGIIICHGPALTSAQLNSEWLNYVAKKSSADKELVIKGLMLEYLKIKLRVKTNIIQMLSF